MAILNTPPTKSNLMRLKHDLSFAQEGYEMLEQKRQILVLELIGTFEKAKRVQQEAREKMAAAYAALKTALMREGTFRLRADASATQQPHTAEVAQRSVMGIYLPTVRAEHPARAPGMSLLTGSPAFDDVQRAFHDAMTTIDQLAEIENAVIRLAREVRKTVRRVNALDKLFIPAYHDTVRYITGVLEERERDEFVIMRMVKERLDARRRGP